MEISQQFKEEGWDILPSTYNDYAKFFNVEEKENLKRYVNILLRKYHETIGMIVLDISLFDEHDMFGIDSILPLIRTFQADRSEYTNWGKQVPIVAFTIHDSFFYKEKALSSEFHIHTYITKSRSKTDVQELQLTAESLYSIFLQNVGIKGGMRGNIDELAIKLGNYIQEINQKSTESLHGRLDIIESHIHRGNRETLAMFDVLLTTSLEQMNFKKCEIFFTEFTDQLASAGLSESRIAELKFKYSNAGRLQKLEVLFKKKKISLIIEYLIDICEDVNLFSGPLGIPSKILSHTLLAISKALS